MNMGPVVVREHGANNWQDEAKQKAADQSLELLRESLKIVDAEETPADIGARLDHVICALQEFRDS